MRVGIITFHHAFNYGAFLQAEGLYCALADLGHQPEIVDYRNPALEATHERCIRYGWHPLRKLAGYQRRSAFIQCLAGLKRSRTAHTAEDIDWSRYDALVYGSDEVWNYASHVHRFDPIYFGGHLPAALRRVAYAPSMGELNVSKAPVPDDISGLLENFHAVGVRDSNTADFMEDMLGKRPPIVVDPVFLSHREDAIPDHSGGKPFVLIYGEIRNPVLANACKAWAARLGCQTISVGYRNPWATRMVLNEGPHEFLGWLRASSAVLTTTFHGTMFSIKFQKPFVTLRSPVSQKKFDPIIHELGLSRRIVTTSEELQSCSPKIDWEAPATTLKKRIAESIMFLRNSLT
jgi:hypothetical protein